MSQAQTSTILLSLCSVRLKEIWETFCLSPELIPLDKRPIPQSMVLIATQANVPHCQLMIVYSPIFKIFDLKPFSFLATGFWLWTFFFEEYKMSDVMFDWYKRSEPVQV